MEMKVSPPWLNEQHPNFARWKKAREISEERGKFVKEIISKFITCEQLNILEIGSGEGGTASVFSTNNNFISLDISLLRLQRQPNSIIKINADAQNLPFKHSSFDLIILQDVIEHLPDNNGLLNYLSGFLKKDGIIFLSTPNRFSLLNIISDPHFGLPLISILNRNQIKKYFLPLFRKADSNRKDIAQLLSLKELKIMSGEYEIILNTKFAISELIKGNKGVIWSSFHIRLLNFILRTGIYKLILKFANDKDSFVNHFFTPTFYLILNRK
jgi:2-polyprenyl-3-methyl-5-hydroxy-6-metoxy-1,4-benzoquinol methylase